MNFRRGPCDEPEINLIPFIDILLVVLIFLMVSTTFHRMRELQINLPVADAKAPQDKPQSIRVAVSAEGRYAVDQQVLETPSVEALSAALLQSAKGRSNAMVVIMADASATHQAVVNVMEASRRSGLAQITFSTQTTSRSGGPSGP